MDFQQTVMVMMPNDKQINLKFMTEDETEDDNIGFIFKSFKTLGPRTILETCR